MKCFTTANGRILGGSRLFSRGPMWLKIYLMVLRVLFGFAGKALPSLTEQNWSHAQELAATLRTSISSIAFFFSFWFEKKMVALSVVASVFGCCFFFTHEIIGDASCFSFELVSSHCAKQLTCIHFVFCFCSFGLFWNFAVASFLFPSFFQMTQSWF